MYSILVFYSPSQPVLKIIKCVSNTSLLFPPPSTHVLANLQATRGVIPTFTLLDAHSPIPDRCLGTKYVVAPVESRGGHSFVGEYGRLLCLTLCRRDLLRFGISMRSKLSSYNDASLSIDKGMEILIAFHGAFCCEIQLKTMPIE